MSNPRLETVLGWLMQIKRFVAEILKATVSPRPAINRLRTTVHFFGLIWRGFVGNRCPIRAAALSYTTLLALVPILVVVLSFSKNLLHERSAEVVPKFMDKMITAIAPQLEVMPVTDETNAPAAEERVSISSRAQQEAVDRIQEYINNINTGALGTVGTIFLVFVGIRLLITIEQTFNDIWGIHEGRSLWRKVVYYWTTVTLGPLLLILAMYWSSRTEFTLNPHTEAYTYLMRVVSLVVLWATFSLMYALLPNTYVHPRAAIAGGIFAGTLWQINSLMSTLYVSRVVAYSKIYGALGIIPVLLVGLYFSWLIILLGAQVSYAVQNVRSYMQQLAAARIDQRGRELLACRAVLVICERFTRGGQPPTVDQIAERIDAPTHWLNEQIQLLKDQGLLTFVAGQESGVVPARPPQAITVADVLDAMRTRPDALAHPTPKAVNPAVEKILADLRVAQQSSPANARFSDLVEKGPARETRE